jgi:hypothetical protein
MLCWNWLYGEEIRHVWGNVWLRSLKWTKISTDFYINKEIPELCSNLTHINIKLITKPILLWKTMDFKFQQKCTIPSRMHTCKRAQHITKTLCYPQFYRNIAFNTTGMQTKRAAGECRSVCAEAACALTIKCHLQTHSKLSWWYTFIRRMSGGNNLNSVAAKLSTTN